MLIYNHYLFPSFQFSSLDLKTFFTDNSKRIVKISVVAIAILSAALATYYIVKYFSAKSSGDVHRNHLDHLDQKYDSIKPQSPQLKQDEPVFKDSPEIKPANQSQDIVPDTEDQHIQGENKQAVLKPPVLTAEEEEWAIAFQAAEDADALEAKKNVPVIPVKPHQPPHLDPLPINPPDKTTQIPPVQPALARFSGNALKDYTAELAGYINKILSSSPMKGKTAAKLKSLANFLTTNDHKNEITIYCKITKPQYENTLYQSFTEAYKTLCGFFQDDEFPIEKKMEALERLEAERNQCVPGRAGLLHDICNSMDEPVDIAKRLPWLIARYKTEILRAVITEAHNTNSVIEKYGIELGLPASVVKAAQADLHNDLCRSHDYYLGLYRSACTQKGCLKFLEDYINSDLPIRATYRNYILRILAEKVSDDQIDDERTKASILVKHNAALKNEEQKEKENLSKKYADITVPEAAAEWEKILKRINLKKDPYIDAGLYAHYYYRLDPEDIDDNRLTTDAIKQFADESLQALHKPHKVSPV